MSVVGWFVLALGLCGVLGLLLIGSHWQRWGFADEMQQLHEATENAKAEMGKALLPAFQRLGAVFEKLPRR